MLGKSNIGAIALFIIKLNALQIGFPGEIDGVENFIQRRGGRRQAQRPAAFAFVSKFDAEVLFQHFAIGLEQRAQQVVKLEHLRVVFCRDDLRRLTVDHLHHAFIIQQ